MRSEAGSIWLHFLEGRPLLLELLERRFDCRQRNGVPDERAGEPRHARFRKRAISVAPSTPIQGIHVESLASDDAGRKSATDDLPIGGNVRLNTEQCLCAAGVRTESRDHLVEDEGNVDLLGELAQSPQELPRLEIGMTALHRLDQDRRQVGGLFADELE